MVNLKSTNRNSQVTLPQKRRRFSPQQLFWFILASVVVHGLGVLLLVKYRVFEPVSPEPIEQKPIEFVVVPEESAEEPPPETNNRAAENSVAEPEIEAGETNDPTPSSPEPPQSEAPKEPEAIAPPPAPEPEPVVEPEPAPPPTPEPVAKQPEPIAPPPQPEPVEEPEPIAPPPEESKQTIEEPPPVLSSSNSNAPSIPQTEAPATEAVENEPITEPETPEKTAALPQQDENSASSLLGGNYQKTLANGGDAFFSPEALEYNSVLNPAQLSALKDIDLSQYLAAMEQRVKPNWNPRHRIDDRFTVLTFDIQKNGQITGLRVTRSSGLADVDRAALEAIQKSAPLPPLPPEFPLESLEINFSFNIRIY